MNLIKKLWEKWKILGHKIGNFQARLILTVFYFVVICPFAAVVKFGSKPLRLKVLHTSNWLPIQARGEDIMSRARRQF
jgi:Saxitoxin biosynthesis operon protein SxtJ